ncbi:ankyrin repeat-containing domain protein [Xylariomycetidae sp. FL2044]|nr:ankyrin repeat-containing domain protein [Xylariomycetidae sp. FL2044]
MQIKPRSCRRPNVVAGVGASINKLPPEILLEIIKLLDGVTTVAALAATNRRHYSYANPILYNLEAKTPYGYALYTALTWGHPATLQKLIDAGVGLSTYTWWTRFFFFLRVSSIGPGKSPVHSLPWQSAQCHPHTSLYAPYAHVGTNNPDCGTREEEDRPRRRRELALSGLHESWEWPFAGNDYFAFSTATLYASNVEEWRDPSKLKRREGYPHEFPIHWTPLHIAAREGRSETVDLLLSHGADIDASGLGVCLCKRSYIGIWELDSDQVLPEEYFSCWTPLHIAICNGCQQTAQLLLSHGASPILEVGIATDMGELERTAVRETPADEDHAGEDSQVTALHQASYHGLLDTVKFILDGGYQSLVDAKDHNGQTPFAYACIAPRVDGETLSYLQEKGADINVDLGGGATPLLEACWHGRYETAIELVDLGADVNAVLNPVGVTPLHACCFLSTPATKCSRKWNLKNEEMRLQVVRRLISAGAKVDARDTDGETPLSRAAQSCFLPVAKALVAAGADISTRNDDGDTLLTGFLTGRCHERRIATDMLEFLLDSGASVNQESHDGFTPLHAACSEEDTFFLVLILLDRGADMSLRTREGELPLGRAFAGQCWLTCRYLQWLMADDLITEKDFFDMWNRVMHADTVWTDEPLAELREPLVVLREMPGGFLLNSPENIYKAIVLHKDTVAIFLLDAGASTSYMSDDYENLLHVACRRAPWNTRPLSIISRLLKKGFNPNLETTTGETPLSLFFRGISHRIYTSDNGAQDEFVLEALLDAGADPHMFIEKHTYNDVKDEDYEQDDDYDPGHENHDQWLDYAHPALRGLPWSRPLDKIIQIRHELLVRLACSRHPIPDPKDSSRISYLHQACCFCPHAPKPSLVQFLLDQGLDANGWSDAGETPLFTLLRTFHTGKYTAKPGYREYEVIKFGYDLLASVQILEEYGAKWNARNEAPVDGRWTPAEELKFLLARDYGDSETQEGIERMRSGLVYGEWDPATIGDDFRPFRWQVEVTRSGCWSADWWPQLPGSVYS